VYGQRRPHHRAVLRVQPHHQPDVARVVTEQPQHILGLASGSDALGGEIGLIRVDRQQRRHLGDGGVVSGVQGFGRVIKRRRQQVGEGIDELVIQRRGKIDGRTRRGEGFHSWNLD
jgi:hypothetical protein